LHGSLAHVQVKKGGKRMGAAFELVVRWLTTIVGGLLTALSAIAIYFTTALLRAAHKRPSAWGP
jgi:hypothetical protein